MTDEIVWEAPPPSRQGQGGGRPSRMDPLAAALRTRPGEWALAYQCEASNVASRRMYGITRGIAASFRPAGAFEATSRKVDGEYRVYARYVGEQP